MTYTKAAPVQEPVVTKTEKGIVLHTVWDDLPAGTKLYTTPPAAQPSTEESSEVATPVHESIEDFKKRLAAAIESMPFGDTAASFAVFIRNFK
jgi:hypothetical protein